MIASLLKSPTLSPNPSSLSQLSTPPTLPTFESTFEYLGRPGDFLRAGDLARALPSPPVIRSSGHRAALAAGYIRRQPKSRELRSAKRGHSSAVSSVVSRPRKASGAQKADEQPSTSLFELETFLVTATTRTDHIVDINFHDVTGALGLISRACTFQQPGCNNKNPVLTMLTW